MIKELENNLHNNLRKFFKGTNKYGEFKDIQNLFDYISERMEIDGFKCHQQFSCNLKNTMIVFQKVEYINNVTINVIVEEETLKVSGVTKNETKIHNEIIF